MDCKVYMHTLSYVTVRGHSSESIPYCILDIINGSVHTIRVFSVVLVDSVTFDGIFRVLLDGVGLCVRVCVITIVLLYSVYAFSVVDVFSSVSKHVSCISVL